MDDRYLQGMERLMAVVQDLSLARNIEEVQFIVRKAARELTGADGATFVLRDGDLCYYADEDAIAPLWKGMRFPLETCISGWAMIHREAAVIEDIYADDRIPADAYRPTFVKSLAMVPIRKSNPIGSIGNYWATRHMPTEGEVKLLQALADSTSIAMENIGLYSQLKDQVKESLEAMETARRAEAQARQELEERQRAEEALKRMQQQLWHSQKMDAIGKFAAGIAHDFNNVLSVILGHGSMMLLDLKNGDPLRESVDEILKAGERAAELTRKILAFSRQQALAQEVLDLNAVIRDLQKLLDRLIGEDIQLETRLASGLYPVLADPGQLEQVLMNLVVNARDAMPKGGRLTIETSNMQLEEDYVETHFRVQAGDYALLAVTDTGEGMDKETQSKVFEPFFTTKEKGKGTGLGLATVYGIVQQSNGHIWVYSEPDQGTCFKIYLPRQAGEVRKGAQPPPEVTRLTGTETILLVEDDEQVRLATINILRRGGYNVLVAKNAGEALLTCEQHPQKIHLMLTDVVMPQMSGVQLAERLSGIRPEMKVLCMSGYSGEAALSHGIIDSGLAYIQKPLTPEKLMLKLRQVLESG